MAKTKNRIPPSKLWDSEDFIDLIAWVDHALQHSEIDFDQTIEAYLKRSRDKTFTLRQIKDRLRRTWYSKGRDTEGTKKVTWQDEIGTFGSICLVGLQPADKERIAAAVKRLEDEYTTRQELPRYRLRSTSTLEDRRTSLRVNLDAPNIKSPISATAQHTKGEHHVIPSAVKREADCLERGPLMANGSIKRQLRVNLAQLAISDNDATLSNQKANQGRTTRQQDLSVATSTPHLLLAVEDSEQECSETAEEECASASSNFAHVEQGVKFFLPDEDDEADLPPLSEGELQGGNLEPDGIGMQGSPYYARLAEAVAEIKKLRSRLHETNLKLRRQEIEVNEQKNKVKFLNSAVSQYDSRDGTRLRQLIADKDREIRYLKDARRMAQVALGTFTKFSPQSDIGHFTIDVEQMLRDIFYNCKQILYKHESAPPHFKPALENHETLRNLVYRSLGLDAPETQSTNLVDFSKLSVITIVRQLTIAALCQWIFDTDFPQFDSSNSTLLSEYRELLLSLDGPPVLRMLDLAAHNSLIDKYEFKESIIQQQAADLAIKLSETLAPFFCPGYEDAPALSGGEFATWNQDKKEWQARRNRFVDIFLMAYMVKAKSILNPEYYEMVVYPPDTRFDSNFMKPETMDGCDADVGDDGERFVAVCVEPAVFAYPKDKLLEESSVQEVVVQSRNFVSRQNRSEQGGRVLIPATVILKKQEQDQRYRF